MLSTHTHTKKTRKKKSQTPSFVYRSYATHLASWGYAVLQYDLATGVNLTPDAIEVGFLPSLVAWAVAAAAGEGSSLDTADRLVVAGHSRGGKLAALQFCSPPAGLSIAAAGLIDPVDSTVFSPESPPYPSAIACFKARDPGPVSLMGAGIVGACNPPGANYPDWAAVVEAPPSWTARILKAAHGTFVYSKPLDVAVDAVCVPGGVSHEVAATTAAAQLTAWFDLQLPIQHGLPGVDDLQSQWRDWAENQGAWMEWMGLR